jgi:hypothetical protein
MNKPLTIITPEMRSEYFEATGHYGSAGEIHNWYVLQMLTEKPIEDIEFKDPEKWYEAVSPTHYTSFAIPPNEYITANNLEWEVGNCIKYVSRYHLKNGKEDLLKAIKYIEMLIETTQG